MPRLRTGLLGGSFNPAHEGHRHISLEALRRLGLDEVWWMVSPQNPLKARQGMAGLPRRMARARAVARHPRIRVTDIELRLGTTYTAETLERLVRRFPERRFVWLMGADNLVQIPRWHRWCAIFRTVPVAVFDRPSYSYRAMAGVAAHRWARYRRRTTHGLADAEPPAWCFVRLRLSGASATAIRARESAP